jgi:hypothetical protein
MAVVSETCKDASFRLISVIARAIGSENAYHAVRITTHRIIDLTGAGNDEFNVGSVGRNIVGRKSGLVLALGL